MKLTLIILAITYLIFTTDKRSCSRVQQLWKKFKLKAYKEYFNFIKKNKRNSLLQNNICKKYWLLQVILLSGDVEIQPGPSCPSCGYFFAKPYLLKKHLSRKDVSSCDSCLLQFCLRLRMEQHNRTVHCSGNGLEEGHMNLDVNICPDTGHTYTSEYKDFIKSHG